MSEAKVMVCARVPKELYDICIQRYNSMTIAVNVALELLKDNDRIQEENIRIHNGNDDLLQLQAYNETLKKELENHKEPDLQLRIKDFQEQNKVKDQLQEARIADLKEQIQALNEQINKKDNQIEELNQTLMAQASNIYNLTQNTKLLPEPKKWWQIWK
jgi:chromosome segregation ATPase